MAAGLFLLAQGGSRPPAPQAGNAAQDNSRQGGEPAIVLNAEKAYDPSDNVREAALGPLRRLKQADADPALVAALDRNDVQLLRTAATLLKTSARSDRTARSLANALVRLTKEGKETSRDARIPLLEAIDIHAGPEIAPDLAPLLKVCALSQATGDSSSRIVAAEASISTCAPSGSVHCGWAWPIMAPCHAGTASGLMWSLRISSSVSAP
jgi:hypothetical protein